MFHAARRATPQQNITTRRLVAGVSSIALAAAVLAIPALLGAGPAVAQVQANQRSFDIPAQSLAGAITAFGRQSGLQVSIAADAARSQRSQAVRGNFAPAEALRQMLGGTGLSFRASGARTMTVYNPGSDAVAGSAADGPNALPVISVDGTSTNGYVASNSASGTKTNTPLIETPQSISVVTRDQIDAQKVDTAKQALRYTVGVASDTRANFGAYDVMYGRGFGLDRYLDGMKLQGNNGFVTPQVDLYGVNRIEVLRGPASVLYGQGSLGGIVNMVSKMPTEQRINEVELQAGTFGRSQAAFDFSGPADKDGKWLYRLTGLARDADSQVDFVKEQHMFIAPSLTWKPTNDTTLTILTNYQRDPKGGYYNFVPLVGSVQPNPNGRIPTNFYAGDPSFNRIERDQYSVGYDLEHRFSDVWTVHSKLRYMHADGTMNQILPFGLSTFDSRTLDRYISANKEKVGALTADNNVQATFDTGPLQHKALFGIDLQRTKWDQVQGEDFGPSLDVFNPVYYQTITAPATTASVYQTQNQVGLYAQDQIKFERLVVTLSGRHDRANTDTQDRLNPLASSDVTDSAWTGRAGVVYLFDNGIAPYLTYANSFQPTAGADFFNNPFKPTTGTLYEGGVKIQPQGWNTLITLAAFDLTQQNVLTADPDAGHIGKLVQTGEVRSRGFEFESKTSLTQQLDLIAAYSYLDPKVTQGNGVELGKMPLWVSHHTASIWGDYTIRQGQFAGFGFGAGIRYVGSSFGDSANTIDVPAYTLVDATVHYDFSHLHPDLKGVRLSVNATNLFDKTYVSECTNENCLYGLRRTVLASLKYRW